MDGMAGVEPANDGIKTRCLTTWLHPNQLEEKINDLRAFKQVKIWAFVSHGAARNHKKNLLRRPNLKRAIIN